MNILIGTKTDTEAILLSAKTDLTLFWEDFGIEWNVSFSSDDSVFHLLPSEKTLSFPSIEHLFIRFPHEEEERRLSHIHQLLTLLCEKHLVGRRHPDQAILNKTTQLSFFGKQAPRTLITNDKDRLPSHGSWIVKSLSSTRSQVCELIELEKRPLSTPVLIQERCEGQQFKAHFIKIRQHLFTFIIKIDTGALDYRHTSCKVQFSEAIKCPKHLVAVAKKLSTSFKTNYLDIDYFETGSQTTILEWNDSPCAASFEKELGKIDLPFSRLIFTKEAVVCLGTREDRTLAIFTRSAQTHTPLMSLYYEDIGTQWNYKFENGILVFYQNDQPIVPAGIYDRGVEANDDHPHVLLCRGLGKVLDLYRGPIVSRPQTHFRNGSKLFQAISSIKTAILKAKTSRITLPTSYFIKGDSELLNKMGIPPLIVKSASGVRSQVVDTSVFSEWNKKALKNVPTLFQEKIEGDDLRLHTLKNFLFAVRLENKKGVDYRYAEDLPTFVPFKASEELRKFSQALLETEQNPFLGIDLLEQNGRYYCLEANPGPGWTYFAIHSPSPRRWCKAVSHKILEQLEKKESFHAMES